MITFSYPPQHSDARLSAWLLHRLWRGDLHSDWLGHHLQRGQPAHCPPWGRGQHQVTSLLSSGLSSLLYCHPDCHHYCTVILIVIITIILISDCQDQCWVLHWDPVQPWWHHWLHDLRRGGWQGLVSGGQRGTSHYSWGGSATELITCPAPHCTFRTTFTILWSALSPGE